MDRFERTRKLFGSQALQRLADAHVTVVGLGAVGSYAVEGLARAGVGHLRLVDFDRIESSNINRQLYALDSTVGRPKTELAAERVRDINPACCVDTRPLFVAPDTVEEVVSAPVDILIDAIDSLNSKVNLLVAAVEAGVPVISSMGAARRIDPLSIRVGDISHTRACPLARFVRKRLRRRGVRHGVKCIYSIEHVPRTRRGASGDEAPCGRSSEAPPGGRVREPLGSLSVLTGMFGLFAAREAIMEIVGPDALAEE